MKLNSYNLTQDRCRVGVRAMLKAIGFTDDDFKKPIAGIANAWIETMPCNNNFRHLEAYAHSRHRWHPHGVQHHRNQ